MYCSGKKVLKKLKISLSKSTIEKLSIADANAVCRLLKSLKTVVDKHENEKQQELENSQKHPVYVIVDEDMVQLAGYVYKTYLYSITFPIFHVGNRVLYPNMKYYNIRNLPNMFYLCSAQWRI